MRRVETRPAQPPTPKKKASRTKRERFAESLDKYWLPVTVAMTVIFRAVKVRYG